jgi:hypothetical protein
MAVAETCESAIETVRQRLASKEVTLVRAELLDCHYIALSDGKLQRGNLELP